MARTRSRESHSSGEAVALETSRVQAAGGRSERYVGSFGGCSWCSCHGSRTATVRTALRLSTGAASSPPATLNFLLFPRHGKSDYIAVNREERCRRRSGLYQRRLRQKSKIGLIKFKDGRRREGLKTWEERTESGREYAHAVARQQQHPRVAHSRGGDAYADPPQASSRFDGSRCHSSE